VIGRPWSRAVRRHPHRPRRSRPRPGDHPAGPAMPPARTTLAGLRRTALHCQG